MNRAAAVQRIYEISKDFHIDLDRIVAIRQQINVKNKRSSKRELDYYIEVYLYTGRVIKVQCDSIDNLDTTYRLLLLAWRRYHFDKDADKESSTFMDLSEEINSETYDL